MQTSVKLQGSLSYNILPIILIIVLIVIIFIFLIKKKRIKETKEIIEVKQVEPKNLNSIKNKYLKKILALENKLEKNKISVRIAYQELSVVIRYFVYDVTNIKVQTYTLEDIKKINMPNLTELIEEYYAPEFAEKSLGNIKLSIEKTRKVIEKWI